MMIGPSYEVVHMENSYCCSSAVHHLALDEVVAVTGLGLELEQLAEDVASMQKSEASLLRGC